MFSSFDNNLNLNLQNPTSDHSADGQRLDGMEQFTLPSYDPWQASIDFMLWPPGSCDYGSHVGVCLNEANQTEPNAEQKEAENIPHYPWSAAVRSEIMSTYGKSYCSNGAPSSCQQRRPGYAASHTKPAPPDTPMSQQSSIFRSKDIPFTTPVWRPNGPTQRFSEKL